MKRKYLLVSVEVWTEEKGDHSIITRRETEITVPSTASLGNITDTVQRAGANMVETLKDYLDNSR